MRPPLRLRPDLVEPQGGMSEDVQAEAREHAVAAPRARRSSGLVTAPEPDDGTLRRLMRFVTGDGRPSTPPGGATTSTSRAAASQSSAHRR